MPGSFINGNSADRLLQVVNKLKANEVQNGPTLFANFNETDAAVNPLQTVAFLILWHKADSNEEVATSFSGY